MNIWISRKYTFYILKLGLSILLSWKFLEGENRDKYPSFDTGKEWSVLSLFKRPFLKALKTSVCDLVLPYITLPSIQAVAEFSWKEKKIQ